MGFSGGHMWGIDELSEHAGSLWWDCLATTRGTIGVSGHCDGGSGSKRLVKWAW